MSAVAFDTETCGLDWFDPEQGAFLVTWATAEGEWWADLSDPNSAEIGRFLAAVEAADVIVGHNLTIDIHMIREALGVDIAAMNKQLEDTDLVSRVLFPEGQSKGARGGHGLKNLAAVYLRVDAKDPEEAIDALAKSIGYRSGIKPPRSHKGPWFAYRDVYRAYPVELVNYAVMDARYTYDLYERWQDKAAGDRVYEMERQVMPILLEAERVGIATDQARVAEFKREFTNEKHEVYDRLAHHLGEQALGGEGSEDALVQALLKQGIPLTVKTDTGKLSTAKNALQPFENEFPVIADLFEYRRLERFLNTYIGPMEGVDVVHPSFFQIGAWTGRMSCSRPNLQNWPKRAGKRVRGVLVPREGHAFVVVDYEGIEARFLAYYLGDPGYREIVATRDPHAWMAAQIWGGDYDDYLKDTPQELTHRQPAKNILYAICYGAGAPRVSNMLRDAGLPCSLDEARKIISKIKSSLPNFYYLTKHRVEPKIKSVGYVNTVVGRKNPVKKDRAYVGLNALIQGSAADIMKLGLINVDRVVKPLGGTPLLVVHDEVVVEVPIVNAEECLAVTRHAMESAWDLNPPLAADGSWVTTSYADA